MITTSMIMMGYECTEYDYAGIHLGYEISQCL